MRSVKRGRWSVGSARAGQQRVERGAWSVKRGARSVGRGGGAPPRQREGEVLASQPQRDGEAAASPR